MAPLFLMAVVFIILAPVFWLRMEGPQAGTAARATENTALYERTYPNLEYGAARLREGQLALWNPYQFCGVPFQADPATGLFQPLHLPLLFLSTERALALISFLCLFLMGAFFALFLRSLELRYLAACFGGIVYAFGGAAAAVASRPELAAPLVWYPLLFWALREYARARRHLLLVLGAIAGAGAWLSGGYALSLTLLLLFVPYATLTLLLSPATAPVRRWHGRCLGALVLLLLMMAGISCVQWLPALLWAAGRAAPGKALFHLELAGHAPATLDALLGNLLTATAGLLPRPGYMGIGTLLLLPAALFHRTARRETIYFTAAGVLAAALAVAPMNALPGLPREAWLFPAAFSFAVLAGLGADRLFTVTRDPRSPFVWIPVLLLLLIAGAIFYTGVAYVRALVFMNVVLLLPFLLVRARWLALLCGWAVTAFLFVDCALASVCYARHPFIEGPVMNAETAATLRWAEEQALQERLFQIGGPTPLGLPENVGMMARLMLAGGSATALDPDQQAWWSNIAPLTREHVEGEDAAMHPSLLNYMAVRVLLVSERRAFDVVRLEREGVQLQFARGREGLRLYRNESALPRAAWVPQWQPVDEVAPAIERLTGGGFDARAACLVQAGPSISSELSALLPATPEVQPAAAPIPETPAPAEPATAPLGAGAARILESRPERVLIQVDAPQPGIVVLADTYAPGWRVTVDDTRKTMLRVNGVFRGAAVPAGAHLVAFTYFPTPFWAGLAVSLATTALLLTTGMVRLLRGPGGQ
ncbi:MAG: YfhO family protein [Candidatus Hydrogenedentes bacterium]|nr:YfhO family protein [Candidatus Hydrogenedentota bacterium]